MTRRAISRLMSEFGKMPPAPGKKRGRPATAHKCPKCGATVARDPVSHRPNTHGCAGEHQR